MVQDKESRRHSSCTVSEKTIEANEQIKAVCNHNTWGFIQHESVNRSCLNSRGLYLNRNGTSVLAKNISD